jgi:hypothetical protein
MDFVTIILSALFLIISSGLALRAKIPKQTIADQKELIDTYEKRLKSLENQREDDRHQHIENVKAIAELQGQINVYKELPLQQLADTMREIAQAQKSILDIVSKK